jgi:hypothetical protein
MGGGKTFYPGAWRFLPEGHPMREVCHHYNNAKTDAHDAPPPAKRTGDHLVRALTEPPADEPSGACIASQSDVDAVIPEVAHGPAGGLLTLGTFCVDDMLTYDQMHTVCGVAKDLWRSLSNLRESASVIRWETCINLDTRVTAYKKNPWPVPDWDMKQVHEALKLVAEQLPPREGGGNRLVSLSRISKSSKSHTYGLLAGPVGMYAFMALSDMPVEVNEAYIEVLRVCHLLSRKSMPQSDMEDLERVVIEAVCKLEFWLPATELDIKCHNLLHLAQKINSTGPVCWTSMWRYESMWGTFAKHARKKDSVGLTTLRRIEEEEALQLHALSNPDAYLLPNKTADIHGHNDLSDYWCPRALFQGRDSLLVTPVVDSRKKRDVPMDKIELQGIHAIFLELFEKYATLWVRFINSLHPELIQADGSVKITANQLKVRVHIENHSFGYMPRQPSHHFIT